MVFYQQEDSSPNEALGIPEQFKIRGMVHHEGEGELSLAGNIEKLMLKCRQSIIVKLLPCCMFFSCCRGGHGKDIGLGFMVFSICC